MISYEQDDISIVERDLDANHQLNYELKEDQAALIKEYHKTLCNQPKKGLDKLKSIIRESEEFD